MFDDVYRSILGLYKYVNESGILKRPRAIDSPSDMYRNRDAASWIGISGRISRSTSGHFRGIPSKIQNALENIPQYRRNIRPKKCPFEEDPFPPRAR